ncbi:MAG: hypothetical protein WBD51_21725 [Burkholderiaceae bacterium]
MPNITIEINRAPVLTLWAYIVAKRLGFRKDEALTVGKALAGVTAHTKGTRIGVFEPTPASIKAARAKKRAEAGAFTAAFMGRELSVMQTGDGLRALAKDKPIDPASVERYFASKFGADLDAVSSVMQALADSRTPTQLSGDAFKLYMQFRPEVAGGKKGWGASGTLSLGQIESLSNTG